MQKPDSVSKRKFKVFLSLLLVSIGAVLFAYSAYLYPSPEVRTTGLDESINITNSEEATFDFEISEPSKVKEVSLELLIDTPEGPPLLVKVNGEEKAQISGLYKKINLEIGEFSEQNTVSLERTEIGFVDQSLIGANVKVARKNYSNKFLGVIFLAILMIAVPTLYLISK